MTIKSKGQNQLAKWPVFFLFWTGLGLSFAGQFYVSSGKAGLGVTWWQAVGYSLGDWYVFSVLSLPVMYLARRFRFESGGRATSVAVHILGSVAFSLAYVVIRAWVGQWQSQTGFATVFKPLLVKTWHFNLLVYWIIVAVSQAFDYYRKFHERELRAVELEKRLAQAKLQALQMQLNPHFLFNSLHSISSLMHRDVEAADRMVAQLGDLLRAALASSDAQEIPLRQELDFLERYLDIERIRFGERLAVRLDVPPELLDAIVPNLILQPLIENAIRHGIEPYARPGEIRVRANRPGADMVEFEVGDSGGGLANGRMPVEGIGLSNTRARLRELYGASHQFQLLDRPGGGLLVRLAIPYRTKAG